jgi:ABC-2 type transport system ATP-binding protein
METNGNLIEVEDLVFSYGATEVLHSISFHVHSGEIVGLLGPNGAGKTTTLKLLTGILSPDHGKVRVNGFSLPQEAMEVKGSIGYVPEATGLYESLSAQEFLELSGRLHSIQEKVLQQRIRIVLEAFGLATKRHQRLGTYSKGMRQKVLLSAALLHDPLLLLLDEPLSGLDVESSVLVKDLLAALAAQGKTIVYSSHVLDVVEKVCNRALIIHHGDLIADGSLEELKTRTHEGSLEDAFRQLTHSESTRPVISQILDGLNL